MFIIQRLSRPGYTYLATGEYDEEADWGLPVIGEVMSTIDQDIDSVCNAIAKLDPTNPEHRTPIYEYLDTLTDVEISETQIALKASVMAFRLKFAGFGIFKKDAVNEEELASKYYSDNIGMCWESFTLLFTLLSTSSVSDYASIPKYVSRFTHLYQTYQLWSQKTDRNREHAEKISALLLLLSQKYSAMVLPRLMGRYSIVNKMVRELLLTMYITYPSSDKLQTYVKAMLSVSYDYLGSIRISPDKLRLMNLFLESKREFIDSLFPLVAFTEASEFPDGIDSSFLMALQLDLLTDVANCCALNVFGEEHCPFVPDRDTAYVMIIVCNEVRDGHYCVTIHDERVSVNYHKLMAKTVYESVLRAEEAARNNDIAAFTEWENIVDQLNLKSLLCEISQFQKQTTISHIDIFPDGSLWNLPWAYLLYKALSQVPESVRYRFSEHPNIAVRMSSRNVSCANESKQVCIFPGWRYNNQTPRQTTRYRGQRYDDGFSDLPGVQHEAIAIEQMLSIAGWDTQMADNCNVYDVIEAISKLQNPSIVHIACHGDIQSGGTNCLWMPCADDKQKASALHYEAVLRVPWINCEFVFVNACFGAKANPYIGGASLGLHEALSVAGARRILGALWPVSDTIAEQFAICYYEYLVRTGDYLEAFTLTRKAMLEKVTGADILSVIGYSFVLL